MGGDADADGDGVPFESIEVTDRIGYPVVRLCFESAATVFISLWLAVWKIRREEQEMDKLGEGEMWFS